MYAVKMWGKDCLPDYYAIISDKEYARYVTFFESEKPATEFNMLGHLVRADEILQSLRMADKVNNKQATLIARYAGKQRDVFGEIVPAEYSVVQRIIRERSHYVAPDPAQQMKKYDLTRLNDMSFNAGDVLYNVFVLCHNPFDEHHNLEWVLSYKSTIHVDERGQRYAYINDTSSRDRVYEFASSEDDSIGFRCEPNAKNKPLLYKGADMGEG